MPQDAPVQLIARSAPGTTVQSFSGGCVQSGSDRCSFIMFESMNVKVNFRDLPDDGGGEGGGNSGGGGSSDLPAIAGLALLLLVGRRRAFRCSHRQQSERLIAFLLSVAFREDRHCQQKSAG
jgi:hypothetical protein